MILAMLPKEMNLAIGMQANLTAHNSIFIHRRMMDRVALCKMKKIIHNIYTPSLPMLDELN